MIVIDNFIADTKLLEDIKNDPTFFNKNGKYFWYDGWWNSPMNSLKKRLIYELWGPSSVHPAIKCEGFEYWTGQFGPDAPTDALVMHRDKDEEHWEKTGGEKKGKVVSPAMGSVFYPVPMEPKFNRLVVFDAGKYTHCVTKVNRGLRSAIAVNLWGKEPSGVKSGSLLIEK